MNEMPIPIASFKDLLDLVLYNYGLNVHTSMPGKVVSFTAGPPARVDVQPTLKRRILQAGKIATLSYPVLRNVPVQYPGSSKVAIAWTLAKDDPVILNFTEASIDAYIAGSGDETDPGESRRFALSDAVAIPVSPMVKQSAPQNQTGGLDIVNANGGQKAEIFLKDDGNIQINGQTIQLNGSSKRFVTWDELNTALQSMVTAINTWASTHVHAGVMPGPSSTSPAPGPGLSLDISAAKTTSLETGG